MTKPHDESANQHAGDTKREKDDDSEAHSRRQDRNVTDHIMQQRIHTTLAPRAIDLTTCQDQSPGWR